MKYIELKGNECLIELSKVLNIEVSHLETRVLNNLVKLGMIEDSSEFFGLSIEQLLDVKKVNRIGVVGLTLGRYDKRVADLFEGLVIMGKMDCKCCGLETERFTERENGSVFLVERCLDRDVCRWEEREVIHV